MIFGTTHDMSGVPRQRLTIAYKASIGIPGTGDKSYPEKLDHFRIVAKNERGDWVEDAALTGKLQNIYTREVVDPVDPAKTRRTKLREFDIVFIQDPAEVTLPDGSRSWDIEEVFRTELAWWSATDRKCFGDGKKAMRAFSALSKADQDKNPAGLPIPWTPCGDGCPQYEKGECKPSGTLNFLFKDNPVIGSIAVFKTTSYESIQRIQGSIMQILQLTGGRLRGVPLKAVLRPGKTRYDGPDGKKKSGQAFFVNIEFRHEDYATIVQKLLADSNAYPKPSPSRMLSEHVEEDIVDIEVESTSVDAGPLETPDPDGLLAACAVFELNAAQRDAMLNVFKQDRKAAVQWLTLFNEVATKNNKSKAEAQAVFGRALLQPGAMESMFAPTPEVIAPAAAKRGRPAATPKANGSPAAVNAPTLAEPEVSTPPANYDF